MIHQELKNAKFVQTEEEYHYYYKIFNKELSRITKDIKGLYKNPTEYLNEFFELMDEATRIGLISKEYQQQVCNRISNELNKPSEFKEWTKQQLLKVKKKLKKNNK
jgi:hypothetical protein